MAGRVPAIHVFQARESAKTWMAGTSLPRTAPAKAGVRGPAMTRGDRVPAFAADAIQPGADSGTHQPEAYDWPWSRQGRFGLPRAESGAAAQLLGRAQPSYMKVSGFGPLPR